VAIRSMLSSGSWARRVKASVLCRVMRSFRYILTRLSLALTLVVFRWGALGSKKIQGFTARAFDFEGSIPAAPPIQDSETSEEVQKPASRKA